MKKIGFIGAYDKKDFLLCIAKIFEMLGKKILIIDGTQTQKFRYIVPAIHPTKSYITEFEGIDVAVGFENIDIIKMYLGIQSNEELEYDIVLIDVDEEKYIESFNIIDSEKVYYVTSFDIYSLKRGLEILSELKSPINMTKVLFSKEAYKENEDYLDYLALGYKVTWNEQPIYFPLDNGDQTELIENQRLEKIKLKNLSAQYKEGLVFIVDDMDKDTTERMIRNVMKNM